MAFTLKIVRGQGDKKSYDFEGEARLGRTSDNDVVVRDPSSSRSHARVYEEGGRFYVEDLKSANGTKLNQGELTDAVELTAGDVLTIGEVDIEFSPVENEAPPDSTIDESAEDDDVDEEEEEAPVEEKPQAPAATGRYEVHAPKALQRRDNAALRKRVRPALAPRPSSDTNDLSAAVRARQKRELKKSLLGRVLLLWQGFSLRWKVIVGSLVSVVGVALLGVLIWALTPTKVQPKLEPMSLKPNGEGIVESFGEGEKVDFSRSDMKSFTFTYPSSVPIVGVLHYQARECAKEEVSIELNGTLIGSIPPDVVEVAQRQIELVLPASVLRTNEVNEIVFDNINNPPGSVAWQIWNIWVEIIPVPKLSAEEAGRRAKEYLGRASKQYEQRDVGAMNLFRSWKLFRDAWLLLEATPERPEELIQLARTRMAETRRELDPKCKGMLLEYQKEMSQSNPNIDAARKVLRNIPAHFEKEHPCFGMSRSLLRRLDEGDFGQ